MATRFELVLAGDGPRARAGGEAALDAIRETEQRLSAFRRDSLTARVNAGAGTAVRVDDEFLELLQLCARVHAATRGAFDPGVGALMENWGFRGPHAGGAARAGFERVLVDEAAHTVRIPAGMQLDFGAVGKGWALDRAAEALRAAGVASALLHGGTSSVLALGAPPGAEAWKVRIRGGPDVALRDAALGVSAPHGRTAERDGRRHGHVLDPRRAAPVQGMALAACTATSAALADAWSTALLVLGAVPPAAPLTWTLLVPDPAHV